MRLTGTTSITSFRLVMAASLASVAIACTVFVRRWSREPFWAIAAALLLLPGLAESSFAFSDNLPSAAFTLTAMALVRPSTQERPSTPPHRWLLIGVLFAAAILTRLDAILTLPFFAGLLLLSGVRRLRQALLPALWFALGAGALLLLSQHATTVSLLQSLHVGQEFSSYHQNERSLKDDTLPILAVFFGLVSPVLLLIGARENWRHQSRLSRCVLTLLPLAYYLFVIPRSLEPRDFLLLGLPFLILHAATGLVLWREMLTSPVRRRLTLARALAICAALVLMGPPFMVNKDGPRTPIGRLWSPPLWRDWETNRESGLGYADHIIDSIAPGQRAVVLSSSWQSDSPLHLQLLSQGWTMKLPEEPSAQSPVRAGDPCSQLAEVYTKGDRALVQYRAENGYQRAEAALHLDMAFTRAYEAENDITCIQEQHYDHAYFTYWEKRPWLGVEPKRYLSPQRFPIPLLHRSTYETFQLMPLDAGRLQSLRAEAQAELTRGIKQKGEKLPLSYAQLHQVFAGRFWTPPQDQPEPR